MDNALKHSIVESGSHHLLVNNSDPDLDGPSAIRRLELILINPNAQSPLAALDLLATKVERNGRVDISTRLTPREPGALDESAAHLNTETYIASGNNPKAEFLQSRGIGLIGHPPKRTLEELREQGYMRSDMYAAANMFIEKAFQPDMLEKPPAQQKLLLQEVGRWYPATGEPPPPFRLLRA